MSCVKSDTNYTDNLTDLSLADFKPFKKRELVVKRTIDILGGFVAYLLLLIATMFLCTPYLLY